MNLPYVVSETYSFFVLLLIFGLIVIGFAIIISLNLFFIKNSRIKNEEFYSKLSKSISELKESIDASSQMFLKIKNNLDNFNLIKKTKKIYFKISNLK